MAASSEREFRGLEEHPVGWTAGGLDIIFEYMNTRAPLALRLGKTIHTSPLRFKIQRLLTRYPQGQSDSIEDWLICLANRRGARVVVASCAGDPTAALPGVSEFSDEELTVAICQLNCQDRPQMLRLAAQLISRGKLDLQILTRLAVMERAEPVLAELARQALKVAPNHSAWLRLRDRFAYLPPLRDVLLHWTRIAEPVMARGRPNALSWRLVS